MNEYIEFARTQIQVTPAKLQVRFKLSYTKALTVLSELKRKGVVDGRGFVNDDLRQLN